MRSFLDIITPYLILAFIVLLMILSFFVFSYVLIFAIIFGLAVFVVNYIRARFFIKKQVGTHDTSKRKKEGRLIEHDEE